VTVYVNAAISATMGEELKKINPRRVIFNPGSENSKLAKDLESSGIETENACTLVLLSTGQY
jgi:uncharacterized protein